MNSNMHKESQCDLGKDSVKASYKLSKGEERKERKHEEGSHLFWRNCLQVEDVIHPAFWVSILSTELTEDYDSLLKEVEMEESLTLDELV